MATHIQMSVTLSEVCLLQEYQKRLSINRNLEDKHDKKVEHLRDIDEYKQ
jgi:hypothetical protein